MTQPPNDELSSSQTERWSEYKTTATALLKNYGPERYEFVNIGDWPDEMQFHRLVLSNPANDAAVARLDRDAVPDGTDAAAIVQPADYTAPILCSPFSEIDDPETLSDAGTLVYELLEILTFIVTSPHPENGNRSEMAKLVRRLHETHEYPLADIKERLIPLAQQRGDLPLGYWERDTTVHAVTVDIVLNCLSE